MEEFRTSEGAPPNDIGWTRIWENSAWLSEMHEREPLLETLHAGCVHYVVVTEDDVIDVLSPEAPAIEEIEPASADDPLPGKSQILRHPEDRDKIET